MLAVIIFFFGKLYQTLISLLGITYALDLPTEAFVSVIPLFLPVSLWLFITHRANHSPLLIGKANLLRWTLTSILVGFVLGILTGYLCILDIGSGLVHILVVPAVQIMNVAVYEEVLFRGFLWGILQRRGWRGTSICLLQAELFWAIYLLDNIAYVLTAHEVSLQLWVGVPIAGLVFSVLAWRARDITSSMIAHSLMNIVGQIVVFYRF
jgi:membrane protease YdiL (CAAX protease family)